jgi:hypothetical protein
MFGSLQHAPQLTHRPFLSFETGRMAVNVRLSLAAQVFLGFFLYSISESLSVLLP